MLVGMFGLGPWEILAIVGVIAVMGGPSMVKKLFGYARTAQKVRSQLTPQAMLRRVLEEDGDDAQTDKPRKKAKRKSASATPAKPKLP